MANTAFEHSPTITVPGSGNSTDNAVVLWNGTTGNNFSNSVVIINSGAVTGVTTLAIGGTLTGVTNLTLSGTLSDGNYTFDTNGNVSGLGTVSSGAITATTSITLNARGEMRFADADSSNYIALESPATVGTSYTMALPAAVPSANDYLKVTSYSGGAGVLEWASVSADTNTTYSTSWVDSSDDAILRLTPSSGSNDDLLLEAGTNITLTPSGDTLTITAAGGSITALSGNAENRIPAFGSTTTVLDGDADFTWDGNKLLVGNGTASTKITKGASFDMDGNADTVMEWRSTGRITHGMTGILDTNTFGAVQFVSGANSPNAGGLMLIGVSHANAGDKSGIGLTAVMRSGEGDNSHTLGQAGSPSGALLIQARQVSGTSWAALDAGENMIVVRNHTTTKYILDADGNTYQTGNVVMGTSGKGIDFSATSDASQSGSTMANELLDDYEEGTWSPEVWDDSNDDGSTGYTAQYGSYVKIGNHVFFSAYFQINGSGLAGMTTTQYAKIGNLPFTAVSTSNSYASVHFGYVYGLYEQHNTDTTHLAGYVAPGYNFMSVKVYHQTNSVLTPQCAIFAANVQIMLSGHYQTAT